MIQNRYELHLEKFNSALSMLENIRPADDAGFFTLLVRDFLTYHKEKNLIELNFILTMELIKSEHSERVLGVQECCRLMFAFNECKTSDVESLKTWLKDYIFNLTRG